MGASFGLDRPRADIASGRLGGRYQIEGALGRGGAAQVYRVTDVSTGRALALKLLRPHTSPAVAALFELEYQTLAGIKHRHCVEVYDFGRDERGSFYTMELLPGAELGDSAPLGFRAACRYVRDAAKALGLLHARKLLHRDVSPHNLWRIPDGTVKLIDFGALTPFGHAGNVMGTPPLVPPEAMAGQSLDQRTDLYALGGVLYFLLSGLHAYPVRALRQLAEAWKTEPRPPSELVAALERPDLEPIPLALDQLVAAMLSLQPLARPVSTAEVIDRLDALLDERGLDSGDLSLSNVAFVGRVRERRRLGRQLELARRGRGQSCIIASEPALGRTRLLSEVALAARVVPSTVVLQVDAGSVPGMYGAAGSLALKLLEALPDEARTLAQPYVPLLAHVSPRLAARLDGTPDTSGPGGTELRVRVQAALRDWFLAVASAHTLVCLVDGLEQIDEGSGAFLLALALMRRRTRVLLVCTLSRDRTRKETALSRALSRASHRMTLSPLSESEAFALLHSVFGDAAYLERLVSRVWRATRGSPGHMLALCRQLEKSKVCTFAQGAWSLPAELPDALRHETREQALGALLDLLDAPARALGRALSVYSGAVPHALVVALAEAVPEAELARLEALEREAIVVTSEEGVRFVHEQHRLMLLLELSPAQRRSAQRAVGEWLLARPRPSVVERLRAGVNLLESGDERGAALASAASLRIVLEEADQLSEALPYLEEALALFRTRGYPPRAQAALLAALAMAGYYIERSYALRYGDQAIAALQDILGLTLARKLRAFIGRKAGLVVALLIAFGRGLVHRNSPLALSFRDAMVCLFTCVAALAGGSAICVDAASVERYAEVLEPLTALGPNRLASFMYEFIRTVASSIRDERGACYPRLQRVIAQLDGGTPIPNLPDPVRIRYLGGALLASAMLEIDSGDARASATADRLECLGLAIHRLSADQVRTIFYGNQGQMRLFKRYRERVEHHAIQQGTSWQIETWSSSAEGVIHLRLHDAMEMKRMSDQLARNAQTVPTLDVHARRARGAYLALRGKYIEALPWLEGVQHEVPKSTITWGHTHGLLAHVYNRLGDFTRAHATCLRALGHATEADLDYPILWLPVQSERLIAEANLGRVDEAQRGLEALFARYGWTGSVLTLGALHETGLEIALATADEAGARSHFEALERAYGTTEAPSLAQHCEWLARRLAHTFRGVDAPLLSELPPSTYASASAPFSTTTVDRMLAGGAMSLRDRAQKGLSVLAEQTRCTHGFLFLLDDHERPMQFAVLGDESPTRALSAWVERRFESELEDAHTQMAGTTTTEAEPDLVLLEGRYYRSLRLFARGAHAQVLVGIAVVGDPSAFPPPCDVEVLRTIGYHLYQHARDASEARRSG